MSKLFWSPPPNRPHHPLQTPLVPLMATIGLSMSAANGESGSVTGTGAVTAIVTESGRRGIEVETAEETEVPSVRKI